MRRNNTQMTCSGAGQGAAGAKRGRKPKVVDDPMEDALLVEHFCGSALSGGSKGSGSSAGIISTVMLSLQNLCTYYAGCIMLCLQQWIRVSLSRYNQSAAAFR